MIGITDGGGKTSICLLRNFARVFGAGFFKPVVLGRARELSDLASDP